MKNIRKTWIFVLAMCTGLGFSPNWASAEDGDANLPDSPSHVATVTGHGDTPAAERVSTWRTLPRDFFQDQKAIWTFPVQLGKGRHWVPTLAIVGGTAGLIYADPHIMPHFQNPSTGLDRLNDVFDPMITTAEVMAMPAGLMAAGYIRHDDYQVGTALLAAEAYGDSAIVDLAVKAVTRRQRPSDIPIGGSFHNTFFNGGKSPLKGSSFPSGHSAAAFSVATVVATRYRYHRWVPWAVYGLATAVSFSRVTSNAHFPSDVFLGAALGYSTARFQVLRPR